MPQRPDPNPLLSQVARDEQWFADILELPQKAPVLSPPPPPKAKKPKPITRYKIVPRDWNRDQWPLVQVAKSVPPPVQSLPDAWPVAEAPVPPRVVQPYFEPVEYLAYRALPESWEIIDLHAPAPAPQPAAKIIVAPAEPTPPPPKLAARPQRERFTWESPEMYHEDQATD
jgi:hypothetical protein